MMLARFAFVMHQFPVSALNGMMSTITVDIAVTTGVSFAFEHLLHQFSSKLNALYCVGRGRRL